MTDIIQKVENEERNQHLRDKTKAELEAIQKINHALTEPGMDDQKRMRVLAATACLLGQWDVVRTILANQ